MKLLTRLPATLPHIAASLLVVSVAQLLPAQAWSIRNVTVVPVVGARVSGATVVVRNGRIEAFGAGVQAPSGMTVVDGSGLFMYPGMIDAGTQLGLTEIGGVAGGVDTREIGDVNPQEVALAGINPHSELIPVTRVSGVTTVLSSAEGGLVSGIASLVNLNGWTAEEMAVRARASMEVAWPSSEGGRGFGGGGFGGPQLTPAERKAQAERQIRSLYSFFDEARGYAEVKGRLSSGGAALPAPFRVNQKLDLTMAAVRGEMPVIVDANSAQQIREVLAFADSLKLRVVLRGGREAWRLADTLAARHIPVIVGPLTAAPGLDDPYDAIYANPGVLAKAGVMVAFQTSDAANVRNLPYNAALASAYGLDPDEALRAVTINPARIFGVEKDYGSIEVGKVANLIVTTGDPLDVRTQVRYVVIGGVSVPMIDRHTRLYEQFRARPKPSR